MKGGQKKDGIETIFFYVLKIGGKGGNLRGKKGAHKKGGKKGAKQRGHFTTFYNQDY